MSFFFVQIFSKWTDWCDLVLLDSCWRKENLLLLILVWLFRAKSFYHNYKICLMNQLWINMLSPTETKTKKVWVSGTLARNSWIYQLPELTQHILVMILNEHVTNEMKLWNCSECVLFGVNRAIWVTDGIFGPKFENKIFLRDAIFTKRWKGKKMFECLWCKSAHQ